MTMIIGATKSLDDFVPDRSGDLTALLLDLIALRDDGLVEGLDSVNGGSASHARHRAT